MNTDRRFPLLILTITMAAALLRFYHLDFNSLWLDEAFTAWFAHQSFGWIWAACMSWEPNPPLFFWLEHAVVMAAGGSDFMLRVIPALAGIATVPVVAYTAREIAGDRYGAVSAILLTVLPFHIYLSQEARAYALAILFVALALYAFVIWHSRKWIEYRWGMYAVLVLGIWTHLFVLFVAVPLIVVDLFFSPRRNLVPPALFTIGIAPLVASMFTRLGSTSVQHAGLLGDRGITLVSNTLLFLFGTDMYTMIVWFGLAVLGMVLLALPPYHHQWLRVLFPLLFLVVFIAGLYLAEAIIIAPRHLAVLIPVAVLCTAYGIHANEHGTQIWALLLGIAVFLAASYLVFYYTVPQKLDYRDAGAYLTGAVRPGDRVIIVPEGISMDYRHYFAPPAGVNETYARNASQLDALVLVPGTTWVLRTPGVNGYMDPGIDAWLQERGAKVSEPWGLTIWRINYGIHGQTERP